MPPRILSHPLAGPGSPRARVGALAARGWFLVCLLANLVGPGAAPVQAQDPGKEQIGSIKTEVLYASEDNLGSTAESGRLEAKELARLQASSTFSKFKEFRRLGSDQKPLLRGYQNWASPLPNSKAIMVAFQPQLRVNGKLRVDLELWQSRKIVLRTDPLLEKGKRVYILGPKFRDGHLIITVELVELTEQ